LEEKTMTDRREQGKARQVAERIIPEEFIVRVGMRYTLENIRRDIAQAIEAAVAEAVKERLHEINTVASEFGLLPMPADERVLRDLVYEFKQKIIRLTEPLVSEEARGKEKA
jgi:hypothetical protein